MAKLDRERRMREKRMDKQARKDRRKAMAGLPAETEETLLGAGTDDTELVRS